MKIYLFITAAFINLIIISCSSKDKKTAGTKEANANLVAAQADSLSKLVIDIHNEGMAGCMKIDELKPVLQRTLDSLNKLPQVSGSQTERLALQYNGIIKRLQVSYDDMYSWMEKMYIGAEEDAPEVRVKKLMEEEIKATKIKEAIQGSLARADSLLKAKP